MVGTRRLLPTLSAGFFSLRPRVWASIRATTYSPTVQDKVIYAGVTCGSFTAASESLAKLAKLDVDAKQAERLPKRLGLERCAERDEAVAAYQALHLVQRKAAPAAVTPPAVVSTDAGRLMSVDGQVR